MHNTLEPLALTLATQCVTLKLKRSWSRKRKKIFNVKGPHCITTEHMSYLYEWNVGHSYISIYEPIHTYIILFICHMICIYSIYAILYVLLYTFTLRKPYGQIWRFVCVHTYLKTQARMQCIMHFPNLSHGLTDASIYLSLSELSISTSWRKHSSNLVLSKA